MANQSERDEALARQGRIVALVIAAGGLLAIFAPQIVSALGLPFRFEILLYLFALAAFVWAIVVTYQIWRKRHSD